MKKSILLIGALLVSAPAAGADHFAGRWNCWHDGARLAGGLWFDAGSFAVNAIPADGRYLAQIADISDDDLNQYDARAYVTFGGSDVFIELSDQTVRGILETSNPSNSPGRVTYSVTGYVNMESHNRVDIEVPSPDGGMRTAPSVLIDLVPVRVSCEKTVRTGRSDD